MLVFIFSGTFYKKFLNSNLTRKHNGNYNFFRSFFKIYF
ncbi:hypothetical protein AWRIB429_2060 [Oenococcus oeni AWRIB429]|uniref:Uncharacterized protein n=2 Tax=root TaxID=1 RepID=V5UQQ4_9CAUD|nr:hypothetical protein CF81_gp45 [Oenococcus phage phiS11]AHB80316.1 hypothetical protein [Oenococcus phage phiS11]EFD87400.1 hypothetical protein AWRIB429_2060 [Oenococcus oeni AWRIB429]